MKTFRLPFASRLARLRTVTAFGAGLLLAQPATAAVAVPLRADYRFTGGFNSFTPGAPPLAPLGPVSFGPGVVDGQARTVLNFSANDGVSLAPMSSVVPGPSYSLVLLFAFDEASDWRRILDFKNAASDTGLYSLSGALNFYNEALGSGAPIVPGTFVQVVLTRDAAQTVTGYVDGVPQFSFPDVSNLALADAGDVLRLFRDEDPVFPGEASAGALARLRVYDSALTSGEVAALDRLPGMVASTIRFSAGSYSFSESAGLAVLVVTRSGDRKSVV